MVSKLPRQWQYLTIPCQPSEERPTTIIDDISPDVLDKQLFSSLQELAKLTCIPITTIHLHLTRILGLL
jgi:hypothetical protein